MGHLHLLDIDFTTGVFCIIFNALVGWSGFLLASPNLRRKSQIPIPGGLKVVLRRKIKSCVQLITLTDLLRAVIGNI